MKLTLGVAMPLAVILGIFTVIEHRRHRAAVLAGVSRFAANSGQAIESGLRQAMLASDFVAVQATLDRIGELQEFRSVYVLDPSGRVIFASGNPEGAGGEAQLENRQPDCQPCHHLPAADRPRSVVVTTDDGERVFRSMHPIENGAACAQCHSPEQRLLGLVLTDIPMAPLETTLAADLRENLLWSMGAVLATVLIANVATHRLVIRRLQTVVRALGRFGTGPGEVRLPPDTADEIGQLGVAFNAMGQRIRAEQDENRELSATLSRQAAQRRELLHSVMTAQEDERRRIARDLHDELGQQLAGLAVGLRAVERLWSGQPDQARSHLRQLRAQIAEMTDRAYDMILTLRPAILDDLGLVAALRAHAERVLGQTDMQFTLAAHGLEARLPPAIETAVFRTVQEALTNIIRHSGAKRVSVSLAARDGVLEGEVADDGRGFDPRALGANGRDGRGLGLLGVEERMALCHGTVEIFSRAGSGTRLRIRVPLPEASRG